MPDIQRNADGAVTAGSNLDKRGRRILWVDDDLFLYRDAMVYFIAGGCDVTVAPTAADALARLEQAKGNFDLLIVDVRLPVGDTEVPELSKASNDAGVILAAIVYSRYPRLPIMGYSVYDEETGGKWFRDHGQYYLKKGYVMTDELYGHAEAIMNRTLGVTRKPRMLIVHGHAETATLALKNFLQNDRGLGEPVILREQPSSGCTIIEKLESQSTELDIVFVLLTPDDKFVKPGSHRADQYRARQNVIFELGYFYGLLRRRSGRVVLCLAGGLELPSDIAGIAYIDISQGVAAAGESIRRELAQWLTWASGRTPGKQ